MKLPLLIASVLFAGAATTGIAFADNDNSPAQKAAETQLDKTATKPHSHVQEKTGVSQTMPGPKADKPNAAKDMSKHNHPRDMK
jgi:hypothetical protein